MGMLKNLTSAIGFKKHAVRERAEAFMMSVFHGEVKQFVPVAEEPKKRRRRAKER